MSLIHPAILFGLGLVAIPVVLHFLLRSKPKKLPFPALRLIQILRINNVRRIRLRHLWLLLLRMAAIALIVFAIARPAVPVANYWPNFREWVTLILIAAVAIGAYVGIMSLWKRKRTPQHVLTYRRTMLRAGTGVVALLAALLLFAWPYQRRIRAEMLAPLPAAAENLPVAGVFLFDTSLSMGYQLENRTRLDRAKEIAREHLAALPTQSQIAIVGTSGNLPILFQQDAAAIQARIDELATSAVSKSLNEQVRAAIEAQEYDLERTLELQAAVPDAQRKDQFLREVYIFTDLARSAWSPATASLLRSELAEHKWLQVYVIDVGVSQPTNVSIGIPRLSRSTLPLGGQLQVEAAVGATGAVGGSRSIELFMQNENGQLVKQGQSSFELKDSGSSQVEFSVPVTKGPISQGELRLVSSDPLSADDIRYFTVRVREPPEILVVGESRGMVDDWLDALEPPELKRQAKSRYRCTYMPPADLATADLSKYATVCLINVSKPSDDAWTALFRYVDAGGGLIVGLGSSRIDPVAYNSEAAQAVLPMELLGYVQFTPPEFLDLRNLTHPVIARLEELGGTAELSSVDVNWCWSVAPAGAASVMAKYTDPRQLPAIVEYSFGKGRTVVVTTSLDMTSNDQKKWSDLPLAGWTYVAFADHLVQYLDREREGRFNFEAGEQVEVALDPNRPLKKYLLRKPGLQQLPGEIPTGQNELLIEDVDQVGHYEVVSTGEETGFVSGFSANAPLGESDFGRASASDLDTFLGEGRYELAATTTELARKVEYGRIGQEVFPLALMLCILAFCAEMIVSNRFYDADQQPERKVEAPAKA